MTELAPIVSAIKEIGFTPVVIILILLFHFQTVRNLEKRNDRLLEIILDLVGRDKEDD